jgi:hypothetical protein
MTPKTFDLDAAIAERQAVTQAHREEAQRKLDTKQMEAARKLVAEIRGEIGDKMADGISLHAGHHIIRKGPSGTHHAIFSVGSDRWCISDWAGHDIDRLRFIYRTDNRYRKWFTPWNAGTLLDAIAALRKVIHVELDDDGQPIVSPKRRAASHIEASQTLDKLLQSPDNETAAAIAAGFIHLAAVQMQVAFLGEEDQRARSFK